MSSATAIQTSSNRRAHLRARHRSRPTSRVSKESEGIADQDAATARFTPSTEIESEIDVELTAPREARSAMTTELDAKVHHHSATKPLKKLSRAGSQISVVEVDDGWPTAAVEVASAKHDVDIGSWRRRTAKTAHPVLSPGAVSRSLLRDQETKPDPSRRQSVPGSGRAEDQDWTRTHRLPEQAADSPPGLSRTVGAPTGFTETQRRASVPVALASYPHASVPSVPFTQLPDLNRIRPIRPALVAEQLLLSEPCQLPRTREFALAPPPYSDADIPPPTPYNEAFPHPLTSYASPGVNASTVKLSGYDVELAKLMQIDRPKALGTILASCDRPGITAPTLAKHLRSYIPDGNGIPGFDNEGAARAALGPVGAAMCRGDERLNELTGGGNGGSGIQPVFTPALNHMPPRLAAQARAETRMREAHSLSMSSTSEYSYRPLTPPASPRVEYPSIKSPGTEEYHAAAALRRASVVFELGAGRPAHQLPSDYFQPRSFPAAPPTAEMPHPPSPSSFHKTELCPAFEETGQCKYGKGCQFAHGLCELRLPLSRSAFTFPAPFPTSHHQQVTSPSGYGFAGTATSPKTELRRASAPHSNLGTVQETEDDQFPFPIFTPGRRSSEVTTPAEVSPGGYDRPIRQASIARLTVPRQALDVARDLASSYSSDMPSTPTQTPVSTSFNTAIATPSDRLSPGAYRERQSHIVHPQASNSSLSSIGGYLPKDNHVRSDESTPTRLSTYRDPTNTVPEGAYLSPAHSRGGQPASPSGGDAASTGSWGSGPKTKSNSTSATVDFSTGRSIWC